jgi:Ser-tRNA(Ala) deacylase AlaX
MKTELVYYGDTYLFRLSARVIEYRRSENRGTVILDKTIFYPQGGGQPTDTGVIRSANATMKVIMVKQNVYEGQVEHSGIMDGDFSIGDKVDLEIDEAARLLHARIHSGGHLLSHAIEMLGIPLVSTSSYHFPSGPYVEYRATEVIDSSSSGLESIRKRIEEQAKLIIAENRPISVSTLTLEEMEGGAASRLSKKARQSELVRMINFEGTSAARPCGGTHVKGTGELDPFFIKKVSLKGNIIRIGYAVGK